MLFSQKPDIILIGLEENYIRDITYYLADKYHFIVINHEFSIEQLFSYDNIFLFVVNMDKPESNIISLVEELKSHVHFQNIPAIGMALKQHLPKMKPDERLLFEDILPIPCGNEDVLNRIEIWVKTYEILSYADVKNVSVLYENIHSTTKNQFRDLV